MNSKTKISKYFKLQKEIDNLNSKLKKLENSQDDIFLKRFITNEKYTNSSAIFKVFINNPEELFDKWDLIDRANKYFCWSNESIERNSNYIIKVLLEEEFIVKEKRGCYQLNPDYINTVKRNRKVKND